jgi:hypothetical protein
MVEASRLLDLRNLAASADASILAPFMFPLQDLAAAVSPRFEVLRGVVLDLYGPA